MAGPYCRFCGQRCFVLRVIPDGPSLIHALLRRYGGEAEITPGELRPQPCPWLTSRPAATAASWCVPGDRPGPPEPPGPMGCPAGAGRPGPGRCPVTPYWSDGDVSCTWATAWGASRECPRLVDAVVTDPPYGLEFMGREWTASSRQVLACGPGAGCPHQPAVGASVVTTPESYIAGQPFQSWCEACGRVPARPQAGRHLTA